MSCLLNFPEPRHLWVQNQGAGRGQGSGISLPLGLSVVDRLGLCHLVLVAPSGAPLVVTFPCRGAGP